MTSGGQLEALARVGAMPTAPANALKDSTRPTMRTIEFHRVFMTHSFALIDMYRPKKAVYIRIVSLCLYSLQLGGNNDKKWEASIGFPESSILF